MAFIVTNFLFVISNFYAVSCIRLIPGDQYSVLFKYINYGMSLKTCANMCVCSQDCEYLVYSRRYAKCTIYNTTLAIQGQHTPGSVILARMDAEKIGNSGLQVECSTLNDTYCPDIDTDNVREYLGNSHVLHAKRKLVCLPSTITVGHRTTVCKTEGTWSGHGLCFKGCKNVVPNINMTLLQTIYPLPVTPFLLEHGLMHEGATVYVACVNRTLLFGEPVVTCTAGKWTTLPTCKASTMRHQCTTITDCVDIQSDCIDQHCKCNPDHSFHPASVSCVSICPAGYGSTFQIYNGRVIKEYNIADRRVSNIEECKQFCLERDTCHTFDYIPTLSTCYINEPLPIPAVIEPLSISIHGRRDCL